MKIYQYHSHGCNSNVKLSYRDGLLYNVEIEDLKQTVNPDPEKKAEDQVRFFISEGRFLGTCKKFKIPYTELERVITFQMWWDKYNYKTGSSKKKSEGIWNKLSKVNHARAYDFIDQYNTHCKLNNYARKLAETYLGNEPWVRD